MNRTLAVAATVALFTLTGVPLASATERAGGWVTSFDGRQLTLLNDPNVYVLAPSVDGSNIKTMGVAHLVFDTVGGRRVVTSLMVASPGEPDYNADDLTDA